MADDPSPPRQVARSDPEWSRRVRAFRVGALGASAAGVGGLVGLLDDPAGRVSLFALAGAALALAVAAGVEAWGRDGRAAVLLAAVALGFGVGPSLWTRPSLGFALALGVMGLLFRSERPLRSGGLDLAATSTLPAWGALGPAVAVALAIGVADEPRLVARVSASVAALFAAGTGIWGAARWPTPRPRSVVVAGALSVLGVGLGGVALVLELPGAHLAVLCAAALPPIVVDLALAERGRPFAAWLQILVARPPLLLAATFGGTAVLGAALLWLPVSRGAAGPISGLDAFFTAVSATCVTGLIVVDTPRAFSGFGQVVLLLLIQIGGLGIMTFSTAFLAALRTRPSVRHERALAGLFSGGAGLAPREAVKTILWVTVLSELFGALALAGAFYGLHGDGLATALWRGLFTAVSAFCNAGFALQSDSLVPYAEDPVVLHVVSFLIVIGGLGPLVVVSLRRRLRGGRLAPAVRVIAITTLALLVFGAIGFAALEWQASLQTYGLLDRLHLAWFHSVTLRTAGFNAVDFAALEPATQVFLSAIMFIGGSPGSTAGGIKTTTFAVVLLSVAAVLRGRPEAVVRRRRISHQTFYRAVAIALLGGLSLLVVWILLMVTQPLAPLMAGFEAVSALATVGLSVGGTAELDEVGKIIIAVAMFIGRLGPLSVLLLFTAEARPPPWHYPETEVPLG